MTTNAITPNSVSIVDWFDIHDREHLQAWSHLCKTGQWPEGFIPEGKGLRYDALWQVHITEKMANAWVDAHALGARP